MLGVREAPPRRGDHFKLKHCAQFGSVEFGVSSALLAELAASPLASQTSPFVDLPRRRGVTWLAPTIGVGPAYAEMTGARLCAPVLRRFTEQTRASL